MLLRVLLWAKQNEEERYERRQKHNNAGLVKRPGRQTCLHRNQKLQEKMIKYSILESNFLSQSDYNMEIRKVFLN